MKSFLKLLLTLTLFFGLLFPANSQININKLKKKAKGKISNTKQESKSNDTKELKSNDSKTKDAKSNKSSKTFYVSKKTGKNSNNGSKSKPYKNIDKAIKVAKKGDKIYIAEGKYSGTFNIGYLESDIPLKLYGSFDASFSKQDIKNHPTVFQPDNKSAGNARKALLRFTKDVDGVVVDNIIWDMGQRNLYSPKEGMVEGLETGRMLLPTEQMQGFNSTVAEPIISIRSGTLGGEVLIQNCVLVNGANYAIQIGHRSGNVKILNNVIVANRMAGIDVFGTCANKSGPKTKDKCIDVEIANNTILFTWSRLKDFLDMGYGIRIMTKAAYNIHNNIIGGSILAGVDHSRFNNDDRIKLDDNIFFVNKKADLAYSPASNTSLDLSVDQFEDLEFASVSGNKSEIPAIPVDKAYLDGFLKARYSETVDFNPNSPANQWREAMGMNKQGKINSKVTMFMNRYPWKNTLELFGAHATCGAQTIK